MISDISYAPAGNHVVATLAGSPHRLEWDRATGDVHLDNSPVPLALHLSEFRFHVQAADYFHVPRPDEHDTSPIPHRPRGLREIPATESIHGAGWMAACSCGHFRTGWCPDPAEAGRRMRAHLEQAAIVRHATSGVEEQPTGDGPRYRMTCSCGIYVTPWFADERDARRSMGAHLVANGAIPQQTSTRKATRS